MNEDVTKSFVKAEQYVREAEALIASSLYKASIGKAYIAMLQAAEGTLIHNSIPDWSKETLHSNFENAFVKTGRLDKKFSGYLREASFAKIDENDNPTAMIEFRQAQTTLVRTKDFIAQCRILCQPTN